MASSDEFAERLGASLAAFLLWPPMAGRVAATLMSSPTPLTLADLQERLGASGGSISEMTRLLLTTGVIQRIKTPGVRRAQFQWVPDAWVNCANHTVRQMSQLKELAGQARQQGGASEEHFQQRLSEMEHYYQLMVDGVAQLAKEYEQAFHSGRE